jgi:hypothetical protein
MMNTSYSWNTYCDADPDTVWRTIAAMFQGLAAQPSWRTDGAGERLLVVHDATAPGQARELGYRISADAAQAPAEVTWQVREVGAGSVVLLTVVDPEDGWRDEVEQGWLPLLARLGRMLERRPVLV